MKHRGIDEPDPGSPAAADMFVPLSRRRTSILAGLLIVDATIFGAAALLFVWYWLAWGGRAAPSFAEVEPIALGASSWAWFGFFFTGIAFADWTGRAYTSASSRGATGQRRSSQWAAVSWFVPVVNLWVPGEVFSEIDRMASERAGSIPIGDRWQQLPVSAASLRWWWVWFLSLLILSAGVFGVAVSNQSERGYGAGLVTIAVAYTMLSLAGYFASAMVRRLGRQLEA